MTHTLARCPDATPVRAAHEQPDERAFRERLQRLEPRALERFFGSESDSIRARVQRLVGHFQEAQDLTQDILLRIHGGLPRFDPSKRLGPWIETILRNRVRDHWRARRSARDMQDMQVADLAHFSMGSGRAGLGSPSAPTEDPRGQRMRRAVDQLAPDARTILLLRTFDELSFDTIAISLGLTPTAARKRYSRALHSLRALLAAVDVHSN